MIMREIEPLLGVLDGSLCGGQTGDGHAAGGAGHIVQTHAVAELHAGGVAAVLAADAQMLSLIHISRSPMLYSASCISCR